MRIRPLSLLLLSLCLVACNSGRVTTGAVSFEVPDGWSRLSPSELQDRGSTVDSMVGNPDRSAIAFAMELRGIVPRNVNAQAYCPGAPAPLASLSAGLEQGLESRYSDYRLLGRSLTRLDGEPAVVLEFEGREGRDPLRWRHLEVALTGGGDAVMFGFGCPAGEQDRHGGDLSRIQSTVELS